MDTKKKSPKDKASTRARSKSKDSKRKREEKKEKTIPVVRQESFRDKLKRTFNLSKQNLQIQTKPKDTKSTSSKGQDSSSIKSGASSNSSNRAPPKRDSEKVEKAPEMPSGKPRISKADKTPEKVTVTPERVPVTPEKNSKPVPRQVSRKLETTQPVKVNRSEEKKKDEGETNLSSKSTESISDAFPVGRSSSRLLASKKGKGKEESSNIAEEGLKIASKLPKQEEFKFETQSTLGPDVISSPSAWMEFRAGQSESTSNAGSAPIRLPDNID